MKKPTLHYNPQTGYYEVILPVQVDALIQVAATPLHRRVLRAVEEDESADITDSQTWTNATERAGNPLSWLGKADVKVTFLDGTMVPLTEAKQQPSKITKLPPPKTKAALREERLREAAKHVPPYRWEMDCLTLTPPPGDPSTSQKVREDIGRLRYEEKQVLKGLRKQWEAGAFQLDPEAARLQTEHEQQQLESVADAVNGSRLH